MSFDPVLAWESLPALLRGALVTLSVTVPVLALGLVFALPIALARLATNRSAGLAAAGYVAVFRGTPSLILLYLIYSGLGHVDWVRHSPAWLVLRHPFPCAVLGFALVHSAYVAEILRGGLAAVPKGCLEAGTALGLSPGRLLFAIRLPMAMRLALRAYQNEVVIIIKATAAVSAVTLTDLTAAANEVFYVTYDPFTPLLTAAAIYWAVINLVRAGFGWADGLLNRHLSADRYQVPRVDGRTKLSSSARLLRLRNAD